MLTDLLGLPLDVALEAARSHGLRVDGVDMTSSGGSVRTVQEGKGGFEKRVIASRGDRLIAGWFRTSLPEGKSGERISEDE